MDVSSAASVSRPTGGVSMIDPVEHFARFVDQPAHPFGRQRADRIGRRPARGQHREPARQPVQRQLRLFRR